MLPYNPLPNLTFLPIDFPKFDGLDEVRANFQYEHVDRVWTQHKLTNSASGDRRPYEHPRDWLPDAQERFPRLIEFIETHMPFRSICMAKIHLWNTPQLQVHVDIGKHDWPGLEFYRHQYMMAPCGYRIILNGEADTEEDRTLYYLKFPDTPEKDWKWARLPEDTNTFVHSSIDSLHGARYRPGQNRMTLLVHGWMDEDRHWEILRRSYDKYRDYAISFEHL